jgi:hypothetical protein
MRWRSRGPGRTRRPALPRHPVRRRSLAADLSPCGRAGRTGLAVAAIGGGSAATRAGVARNSRRPQLRRVARCGRGACGASADHPESLRATRPAVNAEDNDQPSPLPLLFRATTKSGVALARCQPGLPSSRGERASPTGCPRRLLRTTTSCAGPAFSDDRSARAKQKCAPVRSARSSLVRSKAWDSGDRMLASRPRADAAPNRRLTLRR